MAKPGKQRKHRSEAQGSEFESTFSELLQRLLQDHLGLEVIGNRIQHSGSQFGKDIQLRWRDSSGWEVFWQFECKSHRGPSSLPGKEVADKILDVARSSHSIDVWCLALAEIEPSQWIDETLAWANVNLGLPFELEVISPQRNFIYELYACEPDLFARQYAASPRLSLSASRRAQVLDRFLQFLTTSTDRGRERHARPGSPWQLVLPTELGTIDDDPHEAHAYMRGLCATAPWESAVHGWAVERNTVNEPIFARISEPEPGLDFLWLVGAGGEGKSSVLRQVAWRVASAWEGWLVLWADGEQREQPTSMPVEFLSSLSPSTGILVCLDGSEGLTGLRSLRAAANDFARRGVRIFLLFADRGSVWNRSNLPGQLARGLSRKNRTQFLGPLGRDEAAGLVDILHTRGLLHHVTPQEARDKLSALPQQERAEEPWLLPTIMQLTDPDGRGFETILASVISDLSAEEAKGAFLLYLACALTHAAGKPLPSDLAARLVEHDGGFQSSLSVLISEINVQFAPRPHLAERLTQARVLTLHHRVIAEGVVDIAVTSPEFAAWFIDICRRLPHTIAADISEEALIPKIRFVLIDATLDYLLNRRPPLFEEADTFLRELIGLDSRQFPALHRLGQCESDWLRAQLAEGANADDVQGLAASARDSFRAALRIARKVLTSEHRPRPYLGYDLAAEERFSYHAWNILEGTLGLHTGDSDAWRRSVVLSLLAVSPDDIQQRDRSLSTLSYALIKLDETGAAAAIVGALRTSVRSRTSQHHLDIQEGLLRASGVFVSKNDVDSLGEALAPIYVAAASWDGLGIFDDPLEHRERIAWALDAMREWLTDPALLDSARATITTAPCAKPARRASPQRLCPLGTAGR